MNKEIYLERLIRWHCTCAWLHQYRKNENGERMQFYGAPSIKDIAFAAYGSHANEKVVKGLAERLLPCILDSQRIPIDIIKSAFYRANNPISIENWEWEKTLSITCALINKKEASLMGLDVDNKDRDYLFGRLLAVADVLEKTAMGREEGGSRPTNAKRYMKSFSQHPARTWKVIQDSLEPYQAKLERNLGRNEVYFSKLIDDIASSIPFDKFNNEPLSEKYLLGFYCQRHEFYTKKDTSKDKELTTLDQEQENV